MCSSVAALWHSRCYAAAASGVFNFRYCVSIPFLNIFLSSCIDNTGHGDPVWLTEPKPSSAMPKLFLSQSVCLVLSCLSLGSSVYWYCLFLPSRATITGHSIHWPFLTTVACKHVHTYTAPPFSCCPSLSFSVTHTHKSPPPNRPPQQVSPVPFTRSHSLVCKTTRQNTRPEASNPTIHVGGRRPQKSYWQNAMNETERMAEFQTQENCSVPKL